jgi:hypothetical protein
MDNFLQVKLKPSPGFVIKSTTLNDAFYNLHPTTATNTLLEPSNALGMQIPKGLKVFVNIAWDANVPPPPEGSEDVIQKAMLGEDLDSLNPEGWYVPTVVSEGRQDTDKGVFSALPQYSTHLIPCTIQLGNSPSYSMQYSTLRSEIVPSQILNSRHFSSVRYSAHTHRNKITPHLIELAFQRIEAQTSGSILLSRQIGTPNIASKGKLEPRTVQIPRVLYPDGHPNRILVGQPNASGKKGLIEVVEEGDGKRKEKGKGILKTGHAGSVIPYWTWSKPSTKIKIVISVPKLVRACPSSYTYFPHSPCRHTHTYKPQPSTSSPAV